MEYIKTKKGIYEVRGDEAVLKIGDLAFKRLPVSDVHGSRAYVPVGAIVQRSESLPDLADEFHLIYPGDVTPAYRLGTFQEAVEKLKTLGYLGGGLLCKGAIWTEKGLVYVMEFDSDSGKVVAL